MKVHFDAWGEIRFLPESHKGQLTNGGIPTGYRAMIRHMGNQGSWSALFTFERGLAKPGENTTVWVSFLAPMGAREGLKEGTTFFVYDGRVKVAEGTVGKILPASR